MDASVRADILPVSAVQLHSRYDPQTESQRYIDALNLSDSIKYFILIEPGLGYLVHSIKKRFPDVKIIVLHADPALKPLC